jgi:hypothetical protein
MKTKDLVYVGIIAYLAYLLMKKKPLATTTTTTQDAPLTGSTPNSANLPSGGLNLGQNMDLPNLTPTAPNGMSTEVALNSSNVTPLIKDINEPTQVFGNYNLPPAYGASTITSNPLNTVTTTPYPTASTTEYPTASTTVVPVSNIRDFESVGIIPRPVRSATSIIAEPFSSNTTSNPLLLEVPIQDDSYIYNTPTSQLGYASPIRQENVMMIEEVAPVKSGGSIITQPTFETRVAKSLPTQEPILGIAKTIIAEPVKDQIISQCGNSFSIPNNDKEGSYTNYWFDGITYFVQTTSPLMKTVASQISKDLFVEGCQKFLSYKLQNS